VTHLSDRDIEAFGHELDALRDEVMAIRGERDRRSSIRRKKGGSRCPRLEKESWKAGPSISIGSPPLNPGKPMRARTRRGSGAAPGSSTYS
jgi:hypothetical protein